MFENLNNANSGSDPNANNSSPTPNQNMRTQPDVDDIFAETDKVDNNSVNNNFNQPINKKSEIVTKHVGLGASSNPALAEEEDDNSDKKGGKMFTVVVIVMVVVIVGLLAFLVYSKFLQPKDEAPAENNIVSNMDSEVDSNNEKDNKENENLDNNSTTTEPDEFNDFIPLTPGENEPEVDLEGDNANEEPVVIAPVDSDSDGLTDEEELIYGTNPLLVDTDGDGLSDYEEVKIYSTNPLNVDSDGDSYSDGEEVKNGYNPNGAGTLSD